MAGQRVFHDVDKSSRGLGATWGRMVDTAAGVRTQGVHRSYPQVVESVHGAVRARMMKGTARDPPSWTLKSPAVLGISLWTRACGTPIDMGKEVCAKESPACG